MKKVCCLLLSLALFLSSTACFSQAESSTCPSDCPCNISPNPSEALSDEKVPEETSTSFDIPKESDSTDFTPDYNIRISEKGETLTSAKRYNSEYDIEYIISYPAYSEMPLAEATVLVNSTNSAVIASIFKDLCETGYCKTGAWTYYCRGKEVSILSGEIFVDGVNSGLKTAERTFYDEVKAKYLTGEWDGTPTQLNGHEISLSKTKGSILIDGHFSISSHCLDLPEDLDYDELDSFDTYYIFGEGAYAIVDKKLTKFERGNQVNLPGGTLNWVEGTELMLYYCDEHDLLFLTSFTDFYYNVYVFPDRNVSKIKYIGKVISPSYIYCDVTPEEIAATNLLDPSIVCVLAMS